MYKNSHVIYEIISQLRFDYDTIIYKQILLQPMDSLSLSLENFSNKNPFSEENPATLQLETLPNNDAPAKDNQKVVIPKNEKKTSILTTLQQIIVKNFLILGIFVSIIISLSFPLPGIFLGGIVRDRIHIISFCCICMVFYISGITLKIGEMNRILLHYKGIIYGLVTINFITTLVCFALREIKFKSNDFQLGIYIYI